MRGKQQIVVKEYKDAREFERDARKMAKRGYEVVSADVKEQRSGCGRVLALGIFAWIFKPSPVHVVTYRLVKDSG